LINKDLLDDMACMNRIASPHASIETRFRLAPMAVLMAAAMLLVGLVSTASAAAPIGQDGTIHACYRVKGKPKGSLRVVPSAKKRCRRGERKVTWSVAGTSGQTGASGQSGTSGQGGAGQAGQTGATGSSGTEAVLQSKIANLTLKVEGLEGILNGISHSDLLGVLGTLNGVNNTKLLGAVNAVEGLDNTKLTDAVDAVTGLDNTKLTEAVDSLPVIDSLCTQTSSLTGGINSLGLGVKGISVLGLPNLSLNTTSLPTALAPFTCPS
jgi:hypothetical protein